MEGMKHNTPNDELLIEYLVSDVLADERSFIEDWINASEENRRYFESLKKAWQLAGEEKALDYVLNEMNMDEKWNQIKQAINGNGAKIVSIDEQTIEDENHKQEQSRRIGVYRLFVRIAIAASVLLVIGLAWVLFSNNKPKPLVARNTEKKNDRSTFVVRHEVNTTSKEKRIQLADGSLIVLANNSEVTYWEPFTYKRDITLIGKAFFKVAKDKTRPFTVTSGEISTTALGTEFTVTAFKNTRNVVVRLYEGKVVVKAVDKSNLKLKKDVYLLPGQAFVYGGHTTAKVKEFKISNIAAAPEQIMNEELARDNPSLPTDTGGSWYQFNNQSLGEVFDQLAQTFGVQIVYDKKDVQNIYFTSKYSRTDSLENILNEIASLHNLTVTKKDNRFIITK
jgi:transmembrane sensor